MRVAMCSLLLCLLAILHWGYQQQFTSGCSSFPLCPMCVMCTASEIYRTINKTIKQQFPLLLSHCTTTEYIHFSFPLCKTLVSGSEGEREDMRGKKVS